MQNVRFPSEIIFAENSKRRIRRGTAFHADKPFEKGGSGGSADEKSSAAVFKPDVIKYIRLK